MAGLEHGADLDGEWLAAGVALAEADPVGLSPQPADVFLGRAAMRAGRTIGPKPRFDDTRKRLLRYGNERRKGGFAWPISLTMLNLDIVDGNVK